MNSPCSYWQVSHRLVRLGLLNKWTTWSTTWFHSVTCIWLGDASILTVAYHWCAKYPSNRFLYRNPCFFWRGWKFLILLWSTWMHSRTSLRVQRQFWQDLEKLEKNYSLLHQSISTCSSVTPYTVPNADLLSLIVTAVWHYELNTPLTEHHIWASRWTNWGQVSDSIFIRRCICNKIWSLVTLHRLYVIFWLSKYLRLTMVSKKILQLSWLITIIVNNHNNCYCLL